MPMYIGEEGFYKRVDEEYEHAKDDLINGRDTQRARDLKRLRSDLEDDKNE